MYKFITKDQNERKINLEADNWVWHEWHCLKLNFWRQLWVQLKEIERTCTQLKFVNPKLKTINNTSFKLNEENVSDTSFDRVTSVLTVLADRVGNFKQINTEL
jgi:hypothetical protein